MTRHRLQTNRFELKYIIDEPRARSIRDFIRAYVEPDEHIQDLTNCSYPVHSLYLDSPVLLLCRQTLQGMKNRFKLRIRFYDGVSTHPAFLEIKRRLTNVIRKERAALSRSVVSSLLKGRQIDPSDMVSADRNGPCRDAMETFCRLVKELGAQPATYVSYDREAYVSPGGDQLRVTFDRQIQAASYDWRAGLVPPQAGVPARVNGVVLELKFVDRFPYWMREMVWAFNLQRCSMAKYVHCVNALGLRPGRWLELRPSFQIRREIHRPTADDNAQRVSTTLKTVAGHNEDLAVSCRNREEA